MAGEKTQKKSHTNSKITAGILGAVALAAGSVFLFSSQNVSYKADRVIDGDTFITTEGLRIRLAGANAPELGLCGGKDAKQALEKLILNKPLHIKVFYNDPFKRLVSNVYTKDKYVNATMIESGNAYYENHEQGLEELRRVSDTAKEKKIGIFGSKCTQDENPKNKNCNIKGNIAQNQTDKTNHYFIPGCTNYTKTKVQLYMGDRWFCSEQEAEKAGFEKPKNCKQ